MEPSHYAKRKRAGFTWNQYLAPVKVKKEQQKQQEQSVRKRPTSQTASEIKKEQKEESRKPNLSQSSSSSNPFQHFLATQSTALRGTQDELEDWEQDRLGASETNEHN